MFISKEFKAAMAIFRDAIRQQAERTEIPLREVQIACFGNGIFGLLFFYWGIDSDAPFKYLSLASCLFTATFFWSCGIWLYLATPKNSTANWPPQFRTARQIRNGFFKLENYPNLHPQSWVVKGVCWATKKLKRN